MSEDRDAWALLGGIEGLGTATALDLVETCGGAANVIDAAERGDPDGTLAARLSARAIRREGAPAPPELRARLVAAARERTIRLEALERAGIGVLTLDEPDYPARLRATETPPPVLYLRGETRALAAPRAVAVVGTRRPTEEGRRTAARIAGALARAGAVIVSGLAVGIDGAAHAAAIAEAAPTVAVLGGGHDRLFPRAHRRLADTIVAEGGAVVAEVGPGVEPTRWSFPRRNRIVSGLAEATVVVEAAARSGALITAGLALEQGRGCFLVPGSLEASASAGCLAFLREFAGAARIVAGIPELLEDLGLTGPPVRSGALGADRDPELGRIEGAIAQAVTAGAATLDEIAALVAEPAATLLGALTILEMRGLVVAAYGRYRAAGRLATRHGGGGARPHAGGSRSGSGDAAIPGPQVRRTLPAGTLR